ncbi:nuclear transport factor 2 family protein [Rhodanobacter sp. 7MK24]|uniref:nuclear transport factor 2 family protein n=1 Tax=Rhodanobacter sp. 7MK24 TaxID=2775922 RepID=UPI00177BBB7C|nr:nuclear transport factor 2 family protein [Rhodanobacter sp. 7MK24]MBD8880233.1 nuclear transport factor 2 family protein [Rhodanobacter sp. 7MK24]
MTNIRISFAFVAIICLPWAVHATPLAVCSAASNPLPAAAATNDAVAQRLIAEERASWNLAIQRNASAYQAFHAPDFITLTESGVVGRGASEESAMDAQVRFDQCALSGFEVRFVAQNAALVTYRVVAAGLDHGKAFRLDSYASSLWMKRKGAWSNVFYQATPASKP